MYLKQLQQGLEQAFITEKHPFVFWYDPEQSFLDELSAMEIAGVHADYTDRASVKIVKSSKGFEFRNPGLMRIPPEIALEGGESDCRNRILHSMFLLLGLGERAGSGVAKI